METRESISLQQQLMLLVEGLPDEQGRPYTVTRIAADTGILRQTLSNLLNGRADNPRLETLRRLCQFYRISLAYFELPTELDCRAYLVYKRFERSSPLAPQIDALVEQLPPEARHQALTLMQWVQTLSAQRQRKDE